MREIRCSCCGSHIFIFDDKVNAINPDTKADNVNKPKHYNQGNIECIDAMISAFGIEDVKTFCKLNIFKYLWRANLKNGDEDMEKAYWYLNKYEELSKHED